jgi:hypothetical protein
VNTTDSKDPLYSARRNLSLWVTLHIICHQPLILVMVVRKSWLLLESKCSASLFIRNPIFRSSVSPEPMRCSWIRVYVGYRVQLSTYHWVHSDIARISLDYFSLYSSVLIYSIEEASFFPSYLIPPIKICRLLVGFGSMLSSGMPSIKL